MKNLIPKRSLGKTGEQVSIFGLGGEGLLRTYGREEEAVALIHRAMDLGITYFETARAYAGSENYYGMALQERRERRKEIFLVSKSHERTEEGASKHLEMTLKAMGIDYLDLWMVHDVRTPKDLDQIFGSNGICKALEGAKRNKLIRFTGITAHRNPTILSRAIDLFPFDVILIPINPAEPHYWSFLDEVIPKAREKGLGIVGMKTLCRGLSIKIFGEESAEGFLRYALSQPISAAVVGCDSIKQLEMNVQIAQSFQPMSQQEQKLLTLKVKPYSRELMYYKL